MLELNRVFVAHVEITDPAALDEIKKHSLYDEALDSTHAVVYGKSEAFFAAVARPIMDDIEGIKVQSLVGPINAMVGV